MHDDLKLAAKILDFLIQCTTVGTYDHRNSLGIRTYAQLADAMNERGLIRNNPWTAGSIEKFFERLLAKYGVKKLKGICRYEDIGKPDWQFHFGDAASRNLRPPIIYKKEPSLFDQQYVIGDTMKLTKAEATGSFPKRANAARLDRMMEESWAERRHLKGGSETNPPKWLGSDLFINERPRARPKRAKGIRRSTGKTSAKQSWSRD